MASEAWPSSLAAKSNPSILDDHAPSGLAMTMKSVKFLHEQEN